METLQVIFTLVGIVIIIIGAYYATYYIGLKASGQSRGRLRNKNINILDRFSISRDKGFYLVEIGGKVYIIGVPNQSMTLIDTLDAAAFPEAAAEHRDTATWAPQSGGRLRDRMTNKLAAFIAAKTGRTPLNSISAEDSRSFAESMKTAREKDVSGQSDNVNSERTDAPEDEG